MSAQMVIDPLRFARAGESLSGMLIVAELSRLADRLSETDGEVYYRLTGQVREGGKPSLALRVEADLKLTCQRCLESFVYPLRTDATLLLAKNEAQLALWEAADPLCDGVVAEPHMDIAALVEDEILLSLPVAPRHPDGDCRPAGLS